MSKELSDLDILAARDGVDVPNADLQRAIALLEACFRSRNALFVCGNGGSAADAEHIVGELGKGFISRRKPGETDRRALRTACGEEAANFLAERLQCGVRAFSLNSHVSLLTAILNDQGPELVFAQQLFSWGHAGDILLALSTSGNSMDVLWAARVALAQKMQVIAMTGTSGGELARLADVVIRAPARDTAAVQEWHLPFYHVICAEVERRLFSEQNQAPSVGVV